MMEFKKNIIFIAIETRRSYMEQRENEIWDIRLMGGLYACN